MEDQACIRSPLLCLLGPASRPAAHAVLKRVKLVTSGVLKAGGVWIAASLPFAAAPVWAGRPIAQDSEEVALGDLSFFWPHGGKGQR
jgi:hypothetical protein